MLLEPESVDEMQKIEAQPHQISLTFIQFNHVNRVSTC